MYFCFDCLKSLERVLSYLLTNKYQIKVSYAVKVDYYYIVLSNAGFDKKCTMCCIYFFNWFENFERYDDKWHIWKI